MKYPTNYPSVVALLSMMFLDQSSAFQTPQLVCRQNSALHLLPGQGNQLVAAFNAATSCQDGSAASSDAAAVANTSEQHQEQPDEECHRSLVSRIFHLPSVKKKNSSEKDEEKLRREGEVVLYPMVGFRFFTTSDGGSMSFPTKSDAACRLPRSKNEEVFGWFSPSCELDPFSEDICHEP